MIRDIEIDGLWHVPDDQENKIPGTLKYVPGDSIVLELFETFDSYPFEGEWLHQQPSIPVIYGSTKTDVDLTVVGTTITSAKEVREPDGTHRKHVPTYECEQMFFGDHYEANPEFSRLLVEFPGLETWVAHAVDDKLEITLSDETEIMFLYRDTQRINARGELVSDGDIRIGITPDDSTGFEEYFENFVKPLQYFLCFVMGQTIFPDEMRGVKKGMCRYRSSKYLRERGISNSATSIRYPISNRNLMPDKDPLCYFYLSQVEDDIEDILNRWFWLLEHHTPTVELYFDSVYYSNQSYPSITLLNLARALEAYHRKSEEYDNQYIDESEFNVYYGELVDTISSGFPSRFSNHLEKGTFKWANRVSLRSRLKELFRDHEPLLEKIYGRSLDTNELVNDVVELRNDLTHLSGESIRGLDAETKEGHNMRLRVLLELIFFEEVKMPIDGYLSRFK